MDEADADVGRGSRPRFTAESGISPLDPGEAEAIQLAIDLGADFLLIDERRGRQMAAGRRVTVIGSLAIVLECYRRKLIDDPMQILNELRSVKFRLSRRLIRSFEHEIHSIEASR
jgi:predicted nucleic acid-binding protein